MKIGSSQVDSTVKVFGTGPVVIGNRSRIDAGVVICAGNAGVYIGDNVHIANGCLLAGTSGKIVFEDFSCAGAHSKIYTASEDPRRGLTNPTVPAPFRSCKTGDVLIDKHVLIYANVVIAPGVRMKLGSAAAAFSVIRGNVEQGQIVCGAEQKVIGHRDVADLIRLEHEYLESIRYYTTEEHCRIIGEK